MDLDRTASLIDAAGRGEVAALDELVAAAAPRLHAYLRLQMGAVLRAREGSMDLVQSVCREVLSDLRQGFEYRGEAPFHAWLFKVALNKVRDRCRHHAALRRDARRAEALDEATVAAYASLLTPSRVAIGREEVARLEEAFDGLPEDYREVITMARILRMPHEEIAARLGRSNGATRMLLGRALALLGERRAEPRPDRG
jgi:RNA polymerase sigma-70 factor (ECF subfamily)